jgi:hypothetical protein
MDPEEYMIDISNAGDGSALLLLVLPNSYDFYIFG